MNEENFPNNDERMLSLFSHLSLLLGGILVPLIIWAVRKDKSRFVRYHSLQSIFYHLAYAVIIIGYMIISAIIIIITGAMNHSLDKYDPNPMPTGLLILIGILVVGFFIIIFVGLIYSVYVGIKANQGSMIKMPVIGNGVYKKVYGRI